MLALSVVNCGPFSVCLILCLFERHSKSIRQDETYSQLQNYGQIFQLMFILTRNDDGGRSLNDKTTIHIHYTVYIFKLELIVLLLLSIGISRGKEYGGYATIGYQIIYKLK